MIENLLGLLKVWMITKALMSPYMWLGILMLFSIVNIFLAIFVKFKNGFVSLVCFILCEGLGVAALVAFLWNSSYKDELHLGESTVQQLSDVTSQGVVYRKRFRTVTEPLLGITLPDGGDYFNRARDLIMNARFAGNLYMYKSSAYSGVVLCDSEFNSINEQLLYDGLARTTKVTPKQYTSIQNGAIRCKRGMWEISAEPPKVSMVLIEFTIVWLIFILCMCTSVALTTWLRNVIKIYNQ